METTCFVAGIVKGLVECDDATRHFGALTAFAHHMDQAVAAGLVDDDGFITTAGRAWYDAAGMRELPDCRAYMWPRRKWEVA